MKKLNSLLCCGICITAVIIVLAGCTKPSSSTPADKGSGTVGNSASPSATLLSSSTDSPDSAASSPSPTPSPTEPGVYLGMENGDAFLIDDNVADYAKRLNLDTSMPTVNGLFYANGVYLATVDNGDMYVSKNMKKWKMTGQKTISGSRILTDPPRGFLLAGKDAYYASTDGENWSEVKGAREFFKRRIPDAFYKNKIISHERPRDLKRVRTKNLGNYTAILTNEIDSIINEGKILIALDNPTKGDHGFDHNELLYSFDGTTWTPTGVFSESGYSSMMQQCRDGLFSIMTYDCGFSYQRISYELENGGVKMTKDARNSYASYWKPRGDYYSLIGGLLPIDGFHSNPYGYIRNYNPNKPIKKRKLTASSLAHPYLTDNSPFERAGFQDDVVLLQDFICTNRSTPYTCMLNGKLYYYGKYGGIIEVDGKWNQKWVGLYPRETLTVEDMEDPSIGGALGIVKNDGFLWYANALRRPKSDGGRRHIVYKVYCSADGKQWDYVFTKGTRTDQYKVGVDKLTKVRVRG